MASTFDALLRLELQATGENTNTWGEKTNNNIELLADAIAGSTSISLAGSGDFTLSTANAAADQSRKAYLIFTGVLTGNRNVIIPSSSKTYIIANNTTGNYTITIKTSAGTGAVIPQGFASIVACNGTDTILVNESNRVSKAGDTMTGFLTLSANPTNNLHAATKQYVDAATGTDLSNYYTKTESDARFVNLAGSTMTGALTLPGNPTQALHAATKQYVDSLISGSTIPAGIIAMWSGTLLTIPTGWALCMTGDSEVLLADGTSRPIQEIVDGRQEVEVMAFNEDTGLLEPRKVIDWFVNDSNRDEYVRLKIFRGNSALGSKRSLDVTRDHPVWIVDKGWTNADKILPGDKVLIHQPTLTDIGHQAILGQWLGDGSVDPRGVFSVSHGLPQKDYISDTATKLNVRVYEGIQSGAGYGAGKPTFKCKFALNTFAPTTTTMLLGGNKVRPEILAELGPVGLAYWYMDDGCLQTDDRAATPTVRAQIHTEGFTESEIDILLDWLKSSYGLTAIAYARTNTDGKFLRFDAASTQRFLTMIAPYMHPSMRYKLPESLQDTPYLLANVRFVENKPTEQYVTTVEINKLSPSKRNSSRFYKRYDIKVEGLHSFIANGFVVHNCNGANGTPDLRDRFIIGAGNTYSPGILGGSTTGTTSSAGTHSHAGSTAASGGSHSHGSATGSTVLTINQIPSHTHKAAGFVQNLLLQAGSSSYDLATNLDQTTSATGGDQGHTHTIATDGAHSHSLSITSDGAHTHTVSLLPPFYALAFIMKL